MNPALVAAALNQAAGWGLINNLQNQPEPNFSQGGGGGGGFTNGPNNNARKYKEMLSKISLKIFFCFSSSICSMRFENFVKFQFIQYILHKL